MPLKKIAFDGHTSGACLTTEDLGQRVWVLLAQRVELETLAVKVHARVARVVDVGDVAGDRISFVGV